MPLQTQGIVLKNKKIQSLYFLLEIDCPPIAPLIKPGQFVMLKIYGSQDPLLRRSFRHAIFIGGGVGIVSLFPLAEALEAGRKLSVFIGGKTKTDILCLKDFKKLNSTIFVATEDGSLGHQGTVIDLFLKKREKLWREGPPPLYSSGPLGMLKGLARALGSKKFLCEASFEARMACGFGACWGCVIKTKDPRTPYQRVCKEGPVFNLGKIIW